MGNVDPQRTALRVIYDASPFGCSLVSARLNGDEMVGIRNEMERCMRHWWQAGWSISSRRQCKLKLSGVVLLAESHSDHQRYHGFIRRTEMVMMVTGKAISGKELPLSTDCQEELT